MLTAQARLHPIARFFVNPVVNQTFVRYRTDRSEIRDLRMQLSIYRTARNDKLSTPFRLRQRYLCEVT
jgi:hypothetical protein